MKCGISSLQGGHQVAQKSIITTLLLKSESFLSAPFISLSENTGASLNPVFLTTAISCGIPFSGTAFSGSAGGFIKTSQIIIKTSPPKITNVLFFIFSPKFCEAKFDPEPLLRPQICGEGLSYK